ncbi:hypothetical protein [Thermococcus onnurineus]|uniref:hypothetical protein n=1 Tax=Thermococcus onnurineus TaxID=342948 RepID=UPI00064EC6C7|nr:hypothetical protein [Thermococcus onnurineus]
MSLKNRISNNFREILVVYFLYILLFNLVVHQSSLLAEQNYAPINGKEISIAGITYKGNLTCWNSTKKAINYRYLVCRFSASRKAFISRGFKVDFSAESSEPFELETAREDAIIKIPPDFRGNGTLKLRVWIYDVWWIGVIVPQRTNVVLTFNCTEKDCLLQKIEKG